MEKRVNKRKRKVGTTLYAKLGLLFLGSLFLFITVRGISSSLSQENLRLQEEKHALASSNEWIKYEINDRISLDRVANYAKTDLGMQEASSDQVKVVSVDMNKINEPVVKTADVENDGNFLARLQKTVGELFNGN